MFRMKILATCVIVMGFVAFAQNNPGQPQPSSSANCSITPSEIVAGDPLLAAMTTRFNPDHGIINYSWTTTGGKSLGLGAATNLDTAGLAPGNYTATGSAGGVRNRK